MHAAVDTRHAGEAASGGVNGSESGDVRAQQRKRCRGVAVGGEMAVKRFVAFVEGARVARVAMVSGVQVIAGQRKRARQQRQQRQRAVSYANCCVNDDVRYARCGDVRYVGRGDSDSDGDGERLAAGEQRRQQQQRGEHGEQRFSGVDGSGDKMAGAGECRWAQVCTSGGE